MQQTSRQRVMDLVEAIINQIQLASHLQELIDFEEGDTDQKKINQFLLDGSVSLRRNMMSQLGVVNHDYWCALKHSLATWGYSQEVYFATKSDEHLAIYKLAQEQAIMILSQSLGLEITKCARCLQDKLTLPPTE